MLKSNRYIFSFPCSLLLIVLFALMTSAQTLLAKGVKTVVLPVDIKIEENVVKETVVCNLSEEDIFRANAIYFIDGFLYALNMKPIGVIKLTPEGKVVKRLKKNGRGPGEFVDLSEIRIFNNNVALLDPSSRKVLFYTKNFEYVNEFRVINPYLDFQINNNNELVFHDDTSSYYFSVHNTHGKLLRRFGKRVTSMDVYGI